MQLVFEDRTEESRKIKECGIIWLEVHDYRAVYLALLKIAELCLQVATHIDHIVYNFDSVCGASAGPMLVALELLCEALFGISSSFALPALIWRA